MSPLLDLTMPGNPPPRRAIWESGRFYSQLSFCHLELRLCLSPHSTSLSLSPMTACHANHLTVTFPHVHLSHQSSHWLLLTLPSFTSLPLTHSSHYLTPLILSLSRLSPSSSLSLPPPVVPSLPRPPHPCSSLLNLCHLSHFQMSFRIDVFDLPPSRLLRSDCVLS